MRNLNDSEVAIVSGSMYESVDTACALAVTGMVVSVAAGTIAAAAAGLSAIGTCIYSNNSSNYDDSTN
ncbi:hypothetical protein [Intestinirhabdus alba]|uniref:Bacteriocin n=1 Tax=Intestinirhabdus alba TaxID=2899544 RepID=A0A6L6IK86_9ENTR|nr:hypothetical protein [Intestinirhabdus alba]MTH46374.1 hypothetical protein [Intestinirhabdus alba]